MITLPLFHVQLTGLCAIIKELAQKKESPGFPRLVCVVLSSSGRKAVVKYGVFLEQCYTVYRQGPVPTFVISSLLCCTCGSTNDRSVELLAFTTMGTSRKEVSSAALDRHLGVESCSRSRRLFPQRRAQRRECRKPRLL